MQRVVQEDGGPDEGGLEAAVQLPGEAERVGVLPAAALLLVLHHGHHSGRCARPFINPSHLLLSCNLRVRTDTLTVGWLALWELSQDCQQNLIVNSSTGFRQFTRGGLLQLISPFFNRQF